MNVKEAVDVIDTIQSTGQKEEEKAHVFWVKQTIR